MAKKTNEATAGDKRPNLLYIHSDQHNPFVMGCAGDPLVATPNLDGLAARGVRCSNVYCPSPVCVPSRMAMLAGRYPADIQVWTNDHSLDSGIPTLAHAMGAAGYRPVLIGRMHSVGPDQLHGYVERPVGDHGSNWPGSGLAPGDMRASLQEAGPGQSAYQVHDEDVAASAMHFLDRLGVQQRAGQLDHPFSLSVGFMLPHHPYLARRSIYEGYRQKMTLPAIRQPFSNDLHPFIRWWRTHTNWHEQLPDEVILRARAAYWALVAEMDTMIGQILAALEANGLAENTLVVYSSDHGEHAGERDLWMKRTFYEESVKVPTILSWPGVLPQGQTCQRVLSALDLNATMLEALGAPALPGSPGRSALELLRAGGGDWEDLAFSEYALYEGAVQRMVRRDEWKLVYYHRQPTQLFNLTEDPQELMDRSNDSSCQAVLADLLACVRDGWDPDWVEQRLQQRRQEMGLIGQWAKATDAPDQCRWERLPGMTYAEK
jgi:choline-sulfatase